MNRVIAALPTIALLALSTTAVADEVVWTELRSPGADSTSYLQTNWNRFTENYHPTYVLDEDPTTAWIEGVEGNGEGQVLTLPLTHVRTARQVRVRIRNGYQKSRGLLRSNAAPNQVRLRMVDASGAVTGQVETSLEKAMGWQTVLIPMEGGGFDHLEIEVVTTHDGSRYKDTCISDVLVDVDSDEQWSQQVERGRLHVAKTWISERVEAAEYFANQPSDYPFIAAGYESSEAVVQPAIIDQKMDGQRVTFARMQALPTWYDTSATKTITSTDGLWMLEDVLQEFAPYNLAWFETERAEGNHQEIRIDDEDGGEGWVVGESWRSNTKIEWADQANNLPRRLYVRVKNASYGRGTSISETDYVLAYNDAGRVASMYTSSNSSEEGDDSTFESHYVFSYNGEGKIASWTASTRSVIPDWSTEVQQPDGSVTRGTKVRHFAYISTAIGG